MEIVEYIIEKGNITNRDIRKMFDISNRAAMDGVSKLIDMKVLKRVGKGRSTKYELV